MNDAQKDGGTVSRKKSQPREQPIVPAMPADNQAKQTPHPLGPRVIRTPLAHARTVRRRAIVWFAGFASVIVVALVVRPSGAGFGSHTQLGIAKCSWPTTWGIPCPTCGMTTAFAHTMRGQWGAAIRVQPMGWLLAVWVVGGMCFSATACLTGRTWRINWYRVSPVFVAAIVVGLGLAAWGYKILVMRGQFG